MAQEWMLSVNQEHALGRSEAKRRIEEDVQRVLTSHAMFNIVGTWQDNVFSFQASEGMIAGTVGKIVVRDQNAVFKVNLPEFAVPYLATVEERVRNHFATILA